MSQSVEITRLIDRYSYCDCCSPKKNVKNLYEIAFTSGVYTSLIELCEEHLTQLKQVLNSTEQEDTL